VQCGRYVSAFIESGGQSAPKKVGCWLRPASDKGKIGAGRMSSPGQAH